MRWGLGFILFVASVAHSAAPSPLELEAKIALGEVHGRIDHLAFDPARQRLYVAELGNDTVGVVDLKSHSALHNISGMKEPQGIGYVPSTDTLYIANAGDGTVRLFQGADLVPAGQIPLGDDADNVRVDDASHRLYVGYGSGALAVIDTASRKKIADVPLKAHPESFQVDSKGQRIYINVPDASRIAVVDRAIGKEVASWPTNSYQSNYPMALDPIRGHVIAVFRHPAVLAEFDDKSGRIVSSTETCGDSDDVFVDAKRDQLYVSCGEGFIEVFARNGEGYRTLGRTATALGARTSLFAPSIDRLFVAVRATQGAPASIWVYRPTASPSEAPTVGPVRDPGNVVFVCEQGSVKSLMASLYFNARAQERDLRYRSIARGVTPDAAVP